MYVMLVGSLPFLDPTHPNSYPKMVEVRCCRRLPLLRPTAECKKVGRQPMSTGPGGCEAVASRNQLAMLEGTLRLVICFTPAHHLSPARLQRIRHVQYYLPSQQRLSPGCVDLIQRIFVHVSHCSSRCCANDNTTPRELDEASMCARSLACSRGVVEALETECIVYSVFTLCHQSYRIPRSASACRRCSNTPGSSTTCCPTSRRGGATWGMERRVFELQWSWHARWGAGAVLNITFASTAGTNTQVSIRDAIMLVFPCRPLPCRMTPCICTCDRRPRASRSLWQWCSRRSSRGMQCSNKWTAISWGR